MEELCDMGGKLMQPEKKVGKVPSWQSGAVMYLHDLVYMMIAVMVLFLLLFRVIVVSGPSMYDTLINGDILLLSGNLLYDEPQHGDVVVVSKDSYDNGTPIIKRVIAKEGQQVDIDFEQGIVYVDGIALNEPYAHTPTNVEEGVRFPLVVEEGAVFVMGDNRNRSKDSRSPEIGLVDRREILGKAVFLILPAVDEGAGSRDFGRIGVIK